MVGTAQPLCLLRQKPNGVADLTMNLGKGEITAPRYNTGLDDDISSSWSGSVFLDIPFYRTGFSATGPIQHTRETQAYSSGNIRAQSFRAGIGAGIRSHSCAQTNSAKTTKQPCVSLCRSTAIRNRTCKLRGLQ
jgi:hypothetical protein